MRRCKFPQYRASSHFHSYLLTLQASTSFPCTFLRICLALGLHAVVHVLLLAWSAVAYIPCLSKSYSRSRLSSNSASHLQSILMSSRVCTSFSTCLNYFIYPGISHNLMESGVNVHGDGNEDEGVMQMKCFLDGLPCSRHESLRTVLQLNVFVPEFWSWSVGSLILNLET